MSKFRERKVNSKKGRKKKVHVKVPRTHEEHQAYSGKASR